MFPFRKRRFGRPSVWVALAMVIGPAVARQAPAQSGSGGSSSIVVRSQPYIVRFYGNGSVDPIAQRIAAQGSYYASMGEFFRSVAVANLIQEEVYRRRIENRIERVKMFYKIRELRWEGTEEARDRVIEGRKRAFERTSDVIRNLPISPAQAAGGSMLNRLLDRLEKTSTSDLLAKTQPIDLPPNTLRDLRLALGSGDAKSSVTLGDGQDPFTLVLPRLFRKPHFQPVVEAYQTVRAKMVEAVRRGAEVSDQDYDAAFELLDELGEMLDEEVGKEKFTSNEDPRYKTHKECQRFLADQAKQIGLLGVMKGMPEPFKGKTVQELVIYLKTHGYRFDRAEKGGEGTYQALYSVLRDLFVQLSR